ncbi:MAG: hypothetical protein K2X48_12625 [Chitinophagaceae bacterium]|nr:hypothetical protein [Chitinophagaceae bacterium]
MLFSIMLLSVLCTTAQIRNAVDLDKVPPQWVWQKKGNANQWAITNPIQKELQRIFQPLPDGIYATFSISAGDDPAMGAGTPKSYGPYLMLKKYEYVSSLKKIQQEGETGCWIYFQTNTLNGLHWFLPGRMADFGFNGGNFQLYVCNLKVETDANGNRVLYTSSYGQENVMAGYCFSANNKLPVRRLTRKELFTSYKLYMDKFYDDWIAQYEKSIPANEKRYNTLTAEQKKEENYWPDVIQRNKKELSEFKEKKVELAKWYSSKMQSANLDVPAVVERLRGNMEIEKLDVKEGFNVWMDDPSFFDKAKSADAPQFIFLQVRRQDDQLPKKLFVDRFSDAFNLDVLCKMVGETAKKPSGFNTMTASLTTAKTETKNQQEKEGPVSINFQKDAAGSFPAGWNGMKNISVQDCNNSKWLTLSKAGYWYPKQFNKPIEDGFTLSFNAEWNKEISYYSGLFAVTLAEMPYDNVMQGFKTEGNQSDYSSLYDSYAAEFNRITLRFDPYFNDGGQLQVTVYDKRNVAVLDQKVLLPQFFREKNKHQLQISREGNKLIVKDNGTLAGEFDNVFTGAVRYNAYIFSRYRSGNEEETDMYYLNNVQVKY